MELTKKLRIYGFGLGLLSKVQSHSLSIIWMFGTRKACTKQNAGNNVTWEAAPCPDTYLQKTGQVPEEFPGGSLTGSHAYSSNCAEADIHMGRDQ